MLTDTAVSNTFDRVSKKTKEMGLYFKALEDTQIQVTKVYLNTECRICTCYNSYTLYFTFDKEADTCDVDTLHRFVTIDNKQIPKSNTNEDTIYHDFRDTNFNSEDIFEPVSKIIEEEGWTLVDVA